MLLARNVKAATIKSTLNYYPLSLLNDKSVY